MAVGLALTGCGSHSSPAPKVDAAGNKAAMNQVTAMIAALPLVTSANAAWVPETFGVGPSAQIKVATEAITPAQAHAIGLRIEKAVWLSHVAPIESIDIYVGQVSANTADAINDDLLNAAQAHALEAKYGPRPVPLLPFAT